jgi:hypothetical protein
MIEYPTAANGKLPETTSTLTPRMVYPPDVYFASRIRAFRRCFSCARVSTFGSPANRL